MISFSNDTTRFLAILDHVVVSWISVSQYITARNTLLLDISLKIPLNNSHRFHSPTTALTGTAETHDKHSGRLVIDGRGPIREGFRIDDT